MKPTSIRPLCRLALSLSLGLAAAAALPAPLLAGDAAAPAVTLKLATAAPERSVWIKALRDIAADVTKDTAGRVQIKVYPGGVQGDEQTVLRKMRIGQLQGAAFMGQGVRLVCPDATVLQLPLMFRTEKELAQSMSDLAPDLQAAARKNQIEILGWTRLGFAYVYSKKAVAGLADARQAKPWLLPEDTFTEALFQAGSVSGVRVDVSDVLTGLQSGLLDTVYSPPLVMIAMQWHTRVAYKLDVPMAASLGAVVVTAEAWNKVSEADRAKIEAICLKRIDELNTTVFKQNEEADAVMAKQVKVLQATEVSVAEFTKANETVAHQMSGKSFSVAIEKKLQESLARQRAPK